MVISPILLKTRERLQNYGADLKESKKLLTTSFDVPQFPDSEWNNVLSGRAVDDSDIEITMGGSSAPAKIVTNQGEWSIAWKYAAKAILFAFPERKPELEEYEEYVTRIFMAVPGYNHHFVINFDRAVRIRAGLRRDLLLSDLSAFQDLYLIWVLNSGAGAQHNHSSHAVSTTSTNVGSRERGNRPRPS